MKSHYLLTSTKLFALFLFVVATFSSCQKDTDLNLANTNQLKLSSEYSKFRNSVARNSELEYYCESGYFYTEAIYVDGVLWQYPDSGYEYLMYEGLTHVANTWDDYFFCPLEWPTNGYQYGIGFGSRSSGPGVYSFTADVKICIPDKNFSASLNATQCFAMGDESFTETDSIRIVLNKKQKHDLVTVADSIISFTELKNKLGLDTLQTDSVLLSSSLGEVSCLPIAEVYNWDYYGGGTTDIYGLDDAGALTYNLNFGDGLIGNCSGSIDVFLHLGNKIYKCSTAYSIFYTGYLGSRKQLHIYSH